MSQGPSSWFDTRIYLVVTAAMLLVIMFYNIYLAAVGLIILYVLYLYGRERYTQRQQELSIYIDSMMRHLDQAAYYALQELPVGIMVINDNGDICWNNNIITEWLGENFNREKSFTQLWPDLSLEKIMAKPGQGIFKIGYKHFQIIHMPLEAQQDSAKLALLYFTDVTAMQVLREKCQGAMPVLAYVQIDNYADALKGLTDSQRTTVLSDVHQRLDEWVNETGGIMKKLTEDTYLVLMDRDALETCFANKFEILDRIRTVQAGNKIPVTLSMGVAVEEPSIADMGQKAQAGLDLALGRGGDQAAVYVEGKVQFYGGKTKAAEKNTRVKARVIAQAIHELIGDADLVLVMGHANEDFDSLGAALGVAKMAIEQGKNTHIVVSSLGLSVAKITELVPDYEEYKDVFIAPQQALPMATPSTLLFIVDTHRPELVAGPEVASHVDRKVVIDHHRRAETFINNPLLVYLEPSASSTSELVTELLQYYDDKIEFNRLEATSLYAGIILDTKNFAVQTGVRTFEAAAYLRRSGADPTMARQLFRLDYLSTKTRAKIIADSHTLPGGIILSTCPIEVKNAQIIVAQAADMLLNIEGIRASFVVAAVEDGVIVSARSNGELNVQVIMEQLGGGGHQTVAGVQLKNITIEQAKEKITALIGAFVEEEQVDESDTTARG